jgi:hypothetical protein
MIIFVGVLWPSSRLFSRSLRGAVGKLPFVLNQVD